MEMQGGFARESGIAGWDANLGNDGEAAAQLEEGEGGDIHIVDEDATQVQIEHAVQCQQQRGLAGAGTADHTHLLSALDGEGDLAKRIGSLGSVLHPHVVKSNHAYGHTTRCQK